MKQSKITRMPSEIIQDLENSLSERYKNNLISRKDLKLTEGFRLIRRMPEWNFALNKLKTLPKKEDTNVQKKK